MTHSPCSTFVAVAPTDESDNTTAPSLVIPIEV